MSGPTLSRTETVRWMPLHRRCLGGALLIAACLGWLPATAATITVTSLDDDGDGSLREAIAEANAEAGEDAIVFDAGLNGTIVLVTSLPDITDAGGLTIDGDNRITVSGDNAVRPFYVRRDASLSLENLTVSDGSATGSIGGGGIRNLGGTVTLTNSTLSGNSATDGDGGGISNRNFNDSVGTVTVTDSTLSGNSAGDDGGGIFNFDGTVTLTNSTLSGNSAGDGGGIFNRSGGVTVTDSTLSGNSVDGILSLSDGGGIRNSGGTVTVINSTLSDNNGRGISNRNAISGSSGGTVTVTDSILSGNNGGGISNDSGGTVTLTNTTLSGNNGVGIFNGGTLDLTNSTLSDNSTNSSGGGIHNGSTGTATLTDSTLSGNSAGDGGGIFNSGGTVTLTNSTLRDNGADDSNSDGNGGGIFNGNFNDNDGVVTLTDSTLSGNSATHEGGGVFNEGTVNLTNSTLRGNSADDDGGGILNNSLGTLTLTNSTLSGNSAAGSGGGINNSGDLILTNSTLSGNVNGGGIFNDFAGTLTLANNLIANGPGGDCTNTFNVNDEGHNLVEDENTSCIDVDINGNLSGDPMLGPLADNGGPTQTHALNAGSIAIDAAGDCEMDFNITEDQRGLARPQGASCDIGAYELVVAALSKSFIDDPVEAGGIVTLRYVISNLDQVNAATAIAFTDDLDAALAGLAATGLPFNDVCGPGSELSGTDMVSLSGGNLAAGGSCQFDVTLQVPASAAVGDHPSITSAVTAILGGIATTGPAASDTLTVVTDVGQPVPDREHTGTLPSGNTGTIGFTTTDPGCAFVGEPEFITADGISPAPPEGLELVDGLARFTIGDCEPGATVTLSIDYGVDLSDGLDVWKVADPWRALDTVVAGGAVSYTITDGGLNDDDGAVNGTIVDPAGAGQMALGAAPEVAVPVDARWALSLLLMLLLAVAGVRLRDAA